MPPDFISLMMLLFKPIAAIAMIIKNFESSLRGENTDSLTPIFTQIVVIRAAITKYSINIGNARLKLKLLAELPSFCVFFARTSASARVIGMIASVLVSLTVTALSRVAVPSLYILSQVDAAAVTDDVSLIAVPANIPKAFPLAVSKPIAFPSKGKMIAAMTLKKKMTEIA